MTVKWFQEIVLCFVIFFIALVVVSKPLAKNKCNDELNYLNNNQNSEVYCDKLFVNKMKSINFIINYDKKSIYEKITNTNEYDEQTGVWELVSLKKLLLETEADFPQDKIHQLLVGYDIRNSQSIFKIEEKRIIYTTLKYFLFSQNIEFIRENLLQMSRDINKNHFILLRGSTEKVTEKLACFGMLDLDGASMEKIIGSKIYSNCLQRIRLSE